MTEILGPFFGPLRLMHALTGVALVAGMLGRWVTLTHAERQARAGDLPGVQALLRASGVFERTVVLSSQAVLVLGLVAAWSAGYPLLGFLQGGPSWLLLSLLLFLTVVALVPIVFLPRGRAFGAALEDAVAQGKPTARLVAAFADPATRAAHLYEIAAILLVLVLMIARPF